MLAERFAEIVSGRQTRQDAVVAARQQRDAFIAAQFPLLNAAFIEMAGRVTGSHPLLAVTKSSRNSTNPRFPALALTSVRIESTLNGAPEAVVFAPDLASRVRDQFGAIAITTSGLDEDLFAPPVLPILDEGFLLRGSSAAGLLAPSDHGYVTLTDDILENFLATLLIRT